MRSNQGKEVMQSESEFTILRCNKYISQNNLRQKLPSGISTPEIYHMIVIQVQTANYISLNPHGNAVVVARDNFLVNMTHTAHMYGRCQTIQCIQ